MNARTPTAPPIPLVDLAAQHDQVRDEVAAGWARVVETGAFIDGPDVQAFETELAAFSGAAHAIGCASGTDALEIALKAAGVEPGDGVIVPANTFAATAEAVVRMGATVEFADVDPDTMLLDADAAKAALTPRTRAIIPVHLYGQMAPVAGLRALAEAEGLVLVADAAQAQGATAAGEGIAAGVAIAATSFYPGKNLGAYGDGGAVLCDDDEVARIARSIGHHGVESDRYVHVRPGFTSRLDTLQAVVLRAKLARLAGWNEQRRAAAARYHDLLAGRDDVRRPVCSAGNEHVWHLYPVRVADRDQLLAGLQGAGIGAGAHYPVPLHLQQAFADPATGPGAFPVAERAAASVLSLPIFPGITAAQQVRVVETLLDLLDRGGAGS